LVISGNSPDVEDVVESQPVLLKKVNLPRQIGNELRPVAIGELSFLLAIRRRMTGWAKRSNIL